MGARAWRRVTAASLAFLFSLFLVGAAGVTNTVSAQTSRDTVAHHAVLDTAVFHIPRWHAFVLALSREGDWYDFGAAGPSLFDCSGLIYWAYRAAGVPYFGRDTTEMLDSGRLRRVPWSEARPGDLVFFGTGHVELYVGPHMTFGAQQTGTRVGFHRWFPGTWWVPTGVYRVTGAG